MENFQNTPEAVVKACSWLRIFAGAMALAVLATAALSVDYRSSTADCIATGLLPPSPPNARQKSAKAYGILTLPEPAELGNTRVACKDSLPRYLSRRK
ncbi:MAG: hypothetical protein JO356_11960 [Acidobacteria bacterium]|nr:hypothetical protein [Acidobacteriota bacterium]